MKKIIVLCLIFLLSGCVGMGSKFDCNVSSGGKCLPMDKINQMADAGMFNR
jgi:hypothetical protein